MNTPHACIPKADDSSPSIDESSVSISINICSQEKTLLLKVHCKKTRNRHKKSYFFPGYTNKNNSPVIAPVSPISQKKKHKIKKPETKWMKF